MEASQLAKLVNQMTLEEKIGQLTQFTPQYLGKKQGELTGVMGDFPVPEIFLQSLGSVLNADSREEVIALQKEHLKHDRLKIPLIFMRDVIHGYRTIFPVPLGLGATFDPDLVEKVSRAAGAEAASEGIQVTFSPMADLARDARWGRVVEGTGEDPALNAAMSAAMVRGYQGEGHALGQDKTRIAACVKHYAGYGAVTAGRDYSSVDFSRLALHQDYLPAFEAAINAGAKLIMPAFTLFEGLPATASNYLLQTLLREQLKFDGVVISDWGSITQFITMHLAKDLPQAAQLALNAGLDMDMMSGAFVRGLKQAKTASQVETKTIDQAVRNVLNLKNSLGLFEDPYRRIDQQPAPDPHPSSENRKLAKEAAIAATVLLKNSTLLPLTKNQRLVVTGPLADSGAILGPWHSFGRPEEAVSLFAGLAQQFSDVQQTPLPVSSDPADYGDCDVIIAALGEREEDSGESACKTSLELPEDQVALVKRLKHTGKPVVGVVFAGRPLVLTPILPYLDALLYAWFPGTEGGNALASIISGQAVPQGRLPMTLPRATGQVPLCYNLPRTGHVADDLHPAKFSSRYVDCVNAPLFPFGYGLSYGKIVYGQVFAPAANLTSTSSLTLALPVTNESDQAGTATVQCYVGALQTSVVRPEAELKHWQKVALAPHETKQIRFTIKPEDLAYVQPDLTRKAFAGPFIVRIGKHANDYQEVQCVYTCD